MDLRKVAMDSHSSHSFIFFNFFCFSGFPPLTTNRDEGFQYQIATGTNDFEDPTNVAKSWVDPSRKVDPPHVYDEKTKQTVLVSETDFSGPQLLRWQSNPVLKTSMVNFNFFQEKFVSEHAYSCIETESVIISDVVTAPAGPVSYPDHLTHRFASLLSINAGHPEEYLGDPMAFLFIPVFDSFDINTRKVVAVMKSALYWRLYLQNILPRNVKGLTVVLENACDGFFTYEMDGKDANVVGFEDKHERDYDEYEKYSTITQTVLNDGTATGLKLNQDGCPYTIHVYPTKRYRRSIVNHIPYVITLAVSLVFLFTIFIFLWYDRMVERRQRLILAKAMQSTAIVSCKCTQKRKQVCPSCQVCKSNKKSSQCI
jgi:hypothetical protein